ncbi:unnamed protein product [Clonostachys rosea]|uniref:Peptidase M20 dimerisation domain-containing protein n=1 Tax=Bionectria ochroleuca TaxID=29856 RepID=A0ABY6UK71_BIOOC|nr:unnamed protein product [Clonostachys rosea]
MGEKASMLNATWEPKLAPRVQRRRPGHWVVWILVASSMLYYSLHHILTRNHPNQSIKAPFEQGRDSWCPLVDAIEPLDDGLEDSIYFMTAERQNIQAERLSKAVQIPTESFDDNGEVDEDPRWKTFDHFHQVLEDLFPLVHAHFKRQKVNTYGLLFTLRGSNPSLKPVLFTAHQDVVPAGSPTEWKCPPFSGHYDGSWVWGRGSGDCKNVLIGLLSVMESLLSQEFAPQRTIILAFGFDEETGGQRGAKYLNDALLEQWGQNSLLFLMDEGGIGVKTLGDVMYAYPGVGEKGYYDVEISLTVQGGHSSRPPPHTAIGIISQVVVALEDQAYLPSLPQWSPFRRALECSTKFSPDSVPSWLSDALLHDSEEGAGRKLAEVLTDDKWLMQTSQAVDVAAGGVKVNALPESASILINHRVALHESVGYVNDHIRDIIQPIVKKHGLLLADELSDTTPGSPETNLTASPGVLHLRSLQNLAPSPLSPTDNDVWAAFGGTLRHVFESTTSGHNKSVVPVGNIMTGNTDTVHYWNLTKNIYRYTPARDGTRLNTHATDERMLITAHLEGMRVYYDLIRNFDRWQEK